MRNYRGFRETDEHGCCRTLIQASADDGENWEPLDIDPSFAVRRHSPTGFEWGYGGSGPAQLALAILLRECSKKLAEAHYQCFKWAMVATWDRDSFFVTSPQIAHWLQTHQCNKRGK